MRQAIKVVTAAIIRKGDKILIAQRSRGHLAGKWEFPGGAVEGRESLELCLRREIHEELGVEIAVERPFMVNLHDYGPHGNSITLHSFCCRINHGEPRALYHTLIKWVTIAELSEYGFAPADIPVVRRLLATGIE